MKTWESCPAIREAVEAARRKIETEATLEEESAAILRFERERKRGRMWGVTPRDPRPWRWGIKWGVGHDYRASID